MWVPAPPLTLLPNERPEMNLKPLMIVPPLLVGILGYVWMTQPQETVTETPAQMGQAVRFETISTGPITVSATGFGRVAAVREWSAVSQVDGRVSEMVAGLAEGAVVEEGTVLIQIDPTDLELAISKTRANIASAQADLAQIDRQEQNTQSLAEIEQRTFDVAQAEYDRIATLFERGSVTGTARDAAQKTLLAAENSQLNLLNSLALFPAQRASAQATIELRQAELAEAERDLANTTITAPFRGRVSYEAVEVGQFVRTGTSLMTLVATDTFEVVGAFTPGTFGTLVRSALSDEFGAVAQIDATTVIDSLQDTDLSVFVVVDTADGPLRYPARLARFRGEVDNQTGTVGLAVQVDDPLVVDTATRRPPLEIGSFVNVHLDYQPREQAILVPRAIVRLDDAGAPFVYVATPDDTLAIASVVLGPVIGDRVVIQQGLNSGDRIILSAPRPPIQGLPLTLVAVDEASQ